MSIASKIRGWAVKARALAGTHAGQQVGRFVRVAVLAAGTAWLDGGHVLAWPALSAAAAGGVEVAYRQWRQTVTAAEAVPVVVPEPPTPVVVPDLPAVSADPAVPSLAPVPDLPADPAAEGGDAPVADPSQGL